MNGPPQKRGFMDKIIIKEKDPLPASLIRNRRVNPITTSNIANALVVGKAEPPIGGGALFPSLSKGTLKSTKSLTNSHIPDLQLQSLTKVYPDKIMFFSFKHTRKKSDQTPVDLPEINRTIEQIEHSIDSSLRRTRREIADIVDCNPFTHFGTLTFDPKKHPNCSDYDYSKTKFTNWMNGQQKKHGSFPYIAIPERQNNGNLHFHLLFAKPTFKHHKTNLRGTKDNQRQCYKIDSWEQHYGFADFEDIQNKSATGKYIGKYITKDLFPHTGMGLVSPDNAPTDVLHKDSAIFKKYGKRYFSSKGLKKPTKKYNDTLENTIRQHSLNLDTMHTYENDFITATTIEKSAKL